MGSKIGGIFLGVLITVGVIGYYAWPGLKTPKDVKPSKTFNQVPSVLKGNEDLTKLTSDLVKNGPLPIKLDPAEVGREDPLAKP